MIVAYTRMCAYRRTVVTPRRYYADANRSVRILLVLFV
eukprot:COSAG02_NODE_36845_length_449_cov_3.056569_1_plen_37_part_10